MSFFFLFWNIFKKWAHKLSIYSHYENYESIDTRYLSFLSYILEKRGGAQLALSDKILILSWNYDNEIERTIQNYFIPQSDEIEYTSKEFDIIKLREEMKIINPLTSLGGNGLNNWNESLIRKY